MEVENSAEQIVDGKPEKPKHVDKRYTKWQLNEANANGDNKEKKSRENNKTQAPHRSQSA